MKRKKLLVIVAVIMIVLGVCLLPLPMKRKLEVKGYEMSEDGTVVEEVTIEADCWEWNFPFLKDQLTGKVTVSSPSGIINTKLTDGRQGPSGFFQAAAQGYQNDTGSEESKVLQTVSIELNEDVTMIAIRTSSGSQVRRFVGAKDSKLTAENIWSYWSYFYGNP